MHLERPRRAPGPCGAVLIVLTLVALLGSCRAARADVVTLDGLAAPIVRIAVRNGDVTIRTWDRPTVAIDGDPSLSIVRRTIGQSQDESTVLIPRAGAPPGRPVSPGSASLPAESFVVSTIAAGPHEAVVIKSGPDTRGGPVIVTVPNDSVFVFAFARRGNLAIHDLRAGTLVAFAGRGHLSLENVGGAVFAQTGRGALTVADSTLDRVRVRSLVGNIVFERCRLRQIEATSVAGSIVFDDGTFEPGLAHFESTRGNVAIGTTAPVQFGGHVSEDGRVFTNFDRGARITGDARDAQAIVGGGGPVVTATTQRGNVYFYDGSLRSRGRLPAPWRAPIATIDRPSARGAKPHFATPQNERNLRRGPNPSR